MNGNREGGGKAPFDPLHSFQRSFTSTAEQKEKGTSFHPKGI